MKNALRHRFDAGESFTALLVAARGVEHERQARQDKKDLDVKPKADAVHTKSQQAGSEDTKLDLVIKELQQLSTRLQVLESKTSASQSRPTPARRDPPECFYCRKKGHMMRDCFALKRKQGSSGTQQKTKNNGSGNE